jgi:hypothetical protein
MCVIHSVLPLFIIIPANRLAKRLIILLNISDFVNPNQIPTFLPGNSIIKSVIIS